MKVKILRQLLEFEILPRVKLENIEFEIECVDQKEADKFVEKFNMGNEILVKPKTLDTLEDYPLYTRFVYKAVASDETT